MDLRSLKGQDLTPQQLKIIGAALGGLLILIVGGYVIAGQFTQEKSAERTARSVQSFIDAQLTPLKKDARYTDIYFAPSGDDKIFVQGTTEDLKTCEALRESVSATNPPMEVKYMITYNGGRGVFEKSDSEK